MHLGSLFIGEFLGTMLLIILGNGVVSNVLYKKSKGYNSGWVVIAFGWAFAVMIGAMIANIWGTGGHLNPVVTVANWISNSTVNTKEAFIYMGAQFIGAIAGQIIVNIIYWQHIKENDYESVLACHSTGPTHEKAYFNNIFTEYIGTIVLVLAAMSLSASTNATLGLIGPLIMGFVVLSIGLSLGGTTGYAINPFRDLSPRIVYSIMTFNDKNAISNWSYSWIPVVAPMLGGITVGLAYM